MTASSQPAAAVAPGSLHAFFGPGGVLSRTHPGYEFRRGQLQMAEAVEQALEGKPPPDRRGRHRHRQNARLPGPGAALGKRVIISTGTKTLQEQLFYKDVPFLERALFPKGEGNLRVCYMKGRNNYLCRKKLYDLADAAHSDGLDEIEHSAPSPSGRRHRDRRPRRAGRRCPRTASCGRKLDARAEPCIGQKCQQFERCFITEMRRRAAESDIIIVNHHLFFADLAVKQAADDAPDAGVLPEAAAVIFDEAHELEDVATSYFGMSVSNLRFEDCCATWRTPCARRPSHRPRCAPPAPRLRERSQLFFSLLPAGEGRFAFENRREFLEENGDEYLALGERAAAARLRAAAHQEQAGGGLQPDPPRRGVARAARLPAGIAGPQHGLLDRAPHGRPAAARAGRRTSSCKPRPSMSRRSCARRCSRRTSRPRCSPRPRWPSPAASTTSAQRLGLQNARELVVPSHFDYERQAMLYVPPDLPDPRTPQFAAQAAERIRQLLEITRGRAFCLFTSYAQMHDVHERLQGELDVPDAAAGHRAQERAARGVPPDARTPCCSPPRPSGREWTCRASSSVASSSTACRSPCPTTRWWRRASAPSTRPAATPSSTTRCRRRSSR